MLHGSSLNGNGLRGICLTVVLAGEVGGGGEAGAGFEFADEVGLVVEAALIGDVGEGVAALFEGSAGLTHPAQLSHFFGGKPNLLLVQPL